MASIEPLLALLNGPISVDGLTLSAAEIAGLKAVPWSDFVNALQDRLGSLQADALVAEDIIAVAGDFGLPGAPVIALGVKIAALAIENNQSAEPGALTRVASGRRGSGPFDE